MEYETTVSLVFGGSFFEEIYRLLRHRPHVEEHLDVYACSESGAGGSDARVYKYRELKSSLPSFDSNGEIRYGRNRPVTLRDRKSLEHCVESQVPYIDRTSGRVVFISTTYKSSFEEIVTEEEWARVVREDHYNNTCLRTANKHRLAFRAESFTDLFGGRVPVFTRLSLGEYSTYGGTLEARTKCNPIYYLEIENETEKNVKDIGKHSLRLVEILFSILPYDLVARAVRLDAVATVPRARIDNVFDEFKRRFANYNRWRDELWKTARKKKADSTREVPDVVKQIELFIMPKWNGMKATANYCNGYLFVRDSCGSLSTYMVDLPFDNDLILQLEIVDDTDGAGEKLLVITEILAVVVKSHNTLYHVYSKNNAFHDTGRYAGNVSNSITLKTQFDNANDICNTYRLVAPVYSLLVIHYLSAYRWTRVSSLQESATERPVQEDRRPARPPLSAVNTYMRSDRPTVLITTVVFTGNRKQIRDVLHLLDRFHNYESGKRTRVGSAQEERTVRLENLQRLSKYLPPSLLKDRRFQKHCEGLLVSFVCSNGPASSNVHTLTDASVSNQGGRQQQHPALPDHGYFKIKVTDTIDLEYRLSLGLATSASGKRFFRVRDVPEKFPGWAERSSPTTNDRVIIECFYDRDGGCLVFFKDRPDKHKADSDEKITAIDSEIIEKCALCGEESSSTKTSCSTTKSN